MNPAKKRQNDLERCGRTTLKGRIPKKIAAAIEKHGIKGVVNGFITTNCHDRVVFTGWDDRGEVVCALEKFDEWALKECRKN
jgi:hypothetical protein